MTSLTLTSQPNTASVLVQITGAPTGPVTITRTDANGSHPVRLLAGQAPIGGILTVTDYEPSMTGSVRYDVRDAVSVTTSKSVVVADSPDLLIDGGFEAGTTGWTSSSTSLGTVSSPSRSGSGSMAITSTSAGSLNYVAAELNLLTVKPRTRYSFSGWINIPTQLTSDTAGPNVVHLYIVDDDHSYWESFRVDQTSGWLFYSADFVTGTNATQVWLGVGNDGAPTQTGTTNLLYLDDVSLKEVLTAGLLPQVHLPVLPQYRSPLTSVLDYSSDRHSTSTTHEVVGRPDPLVTIGLLQSRRGTYKIWAPDHPAARFIESIANIGEVMMLRQVDHDGMDCYFVADDVRVSPDQNTADGYRWIVEISYIEVAVPTSPLMGSVGWTFETVTAVGTFDDVKSLYPTFADLLVGPN